MPYYGKGGGRGTILHPFPSFLGGIFWQKGGEIKMLASFSFISELKHCVRDIETRPIRLRLLKPDWLTWYLFHWEREGRSFHRRMWEGEREGRCEITDLIHFSKFLFASELHTIPVFTGIFMLLFYALNCSENVSDYRWYCSSIFIVLTSCEFYLKEHISL